ncbi:Hypothetical protein SMAX5B_009548 [Scophthalmus maximus]|uniref:Uncharacterized protein n=1 Tax=Scophthalmus maximus TaxID=52904 RepID=A0A2U9AZD2_SCOMX|nr:Hypothetical protein SMAX5B_009548 [Scophthalmus maximus]
MSQKFASLNMFSMESFSSSKVPYCQVIQQLRSHDIMHLQNNECITVKQSELPRLLPCGFAVCHRTVRDIGSSQRNKYSD